MPQKSVWENEYTKPQLITGGTEPQGDVKRFIRWLKKDQKRALPGMRVLDLGSGLGKNAIFMSEREAEVVGIEISETAIREAKKRALESGVTVTFLQGDIGSTLPFAGASFDIALDVISSNSLDEAGRKTYMQETSRVLKSGGYFFVRALCKDGDKNAENLLRDHPGKEKDTYTMPGLKLTERVFSKADFESLYSKLFVMKHLFKKSGYAQFQGTIYKRNYWVGYLVKK